MNVLSYLGGLFDGEGNAGIVSIQRKFLPSAIKKSRAPNEVPYIQLKMTDPEPVLLLHQTFGGGKHVPTYTLPSGKTVYVWRISHRKAQQAANILLPYVRSASKQAQLQKVIDHYTPSKS